MKRLFLMSIGLMACGFAHGQSFQQYLALRKQYKITSPVSVEALKGFEGDKVLELRAVVNGTCRVGNGGVLMLADSSSVVDTDVVPDWLVGNQSPVRLLVRATSSSNSSQPHLALIAVVTEPQIAPYEQQINAKRKAAEANAKTKSARYRNTGSGGLYGPIGRGVSYNRSSSSAASAKNWTLPASDVTPIYARYIRHENPRLSGAEANRIAQGIIGFSIQYQVDARLIMAMVMVESGFDPNAVSRTGAMGLGQLMPGTASELSVSHPFDSMDNLYGTVKLVRTNLDQYKAQTGKDFDALVLSLAAYNAGRGAVKRAGGVPAYQETQNYVRKVISLYYQLAGGA